MNSMQLFITGHHLVIMKIAALLDNKLDLISLQRYKFYEKDNPSIPLTLADNTKYPFSLWSTANISSVKILKLLTFENMHLHFNYQKKNMHLNCRNYPTYIPNRNSKLMGCITVQVLIWTFLCSVIKIQAHQLTFVNTHFYASKFKVFLGHHLPHTWADTILSLCYAPLFSTV